MRAIRVLALSTVVEQWRNRGYQAALIFAGVMLYLSVLLGALAVEQELRAILDFGLSFIELMGLASAVFGASTLLLREMETKGIYLVLSRPVSRLEYLLGRVMGLFASTVLAVLAMSAAHLAILLFKGWAFQGAYALALAAVCLKVLVATCLAALVAIFSSSPLTALTITAIFWTLGHFTREMRFLLGKGGSLLFTGPVRVALYLVPDLQLFNLRDRLDVPAYLSPGEPLVLGVAYAGLYSAVCLALAHSLLRRKDF